MSGEKQGPPDGGDLRPPRKEWGNGTARAFLGAIALILILAGIFSHTVHLSEWLAAPFVLLGLVFAVLCGFYDDLEGRVMNRQIIVRFRSPHRRRGRVDGAIAKGHEPPKEHAKPSLELLEPPAFMPPGAAAGDERGRST